MSRRGTGLVVHTSILAALLALPHWAGHASPAPSTAAVPGLLQLTAGESAVFTVPHAGAVEREATVRLEEYAGSDVVVRLTAVSEAGEPFGSGRLIALDALEHREEQIGDVPGVGSASALRVESLEGEGAVAIVLPFAWERVAPAATASRRRAVRIATTSQLIDQAEAAGTIDSETALVYRVYALFGDARLPTQYQGRSDRSEDSLYLAEVRHRFSSLSPTTQAIVEPFLTPPAYPASWINAASRGIGASASPPLCAIFSDRWTGVNTTNGMARVWYRVESDDALRANGVAAEIDARIWPALSGMMPTHLPLSDFAESCNGGSGRLDIYLVDAPKSLAVPYRGCAAVPVFILLKRTAPFSLAAHEIFHAFEFSFPLAGCIFDRAKYRWWAEASAEWAQDFVYPADQTEHGKAPAFLGVPERSLDDPDDQHAYGAYLFPFFVRQKAGGTAVIRQAWENCATQPALEAIDQALPGGFAAVWPEFVVSNWNRDPITDYASWDALREAAARAGGGIFDVRLSGMDAVDTIDVDLPRLSATYKHYKFSDDLVRTVAFWNGATSELTLQDEYQTDAVSQDRKKGARVQALVKIRNQSWKLEDWTNRQFVTYCRDMVNERIEELVIIISNSEFSDRNRRLQPAGLAPLVWISNMGCWQWKGVASLAATNGTTTINIETNVTWKRQSGTPPYVVYAAEGTENWRVSGPCNGSGSFPLNAAQGHLRTYNFSPASGRNHRAYFASGLDTHSVTVSCPEGKTATFTLVPWLIVPPESLPDGSQLLRVEPAGKFINHVTPSNEVVWQWQFEALRQ